MEKETNDDADLQSSLDAGQDNAGQNLRPEDFVSVAKHALTNILLVLKILVALAMFLLGLLDEGRKLFPIPDVDPVEQAGDSLALSSLGMVVNVGVGCPIMERLGELVSELIKTL